jgi:hypothetical protein
VFPALALAPCRAGRELGFRAPVWQKGFSEVRIVDTEAFLRTAEYIQNNPVARLADEASKYPYSSAYPGFELDSAPQGLKPVYQRSTQRYG